MREKTRTEEQNRGRHKNRDGGKRDRTPRFSSPGNVPWLSGAAILFAAALALLLAARKFPGFAPWYTARLYPLWVNSLGRFWGIFPFSAAEAGIYLLLAGSTVYVARHWREPFRMLSRALFLGGALLFLYSATCGVNYYSTSFSDGLSYGREAHTAEQLEEFLRYLTEKANEYADCAGARLTAGEYAKDGVEAMKALGERDSRLSGYYPRPKYLTVPWILSVQQLAGIYSPFTVEANYNNAMVPYNIPHTLCHELSHLKGFMREDEANFIGFLACLESERREFRYSGYVMGWIYAGNALTAADPERYFAVRAQLDPEVLADLEENNRFWARYEGRVAEVAEAVNDTYLKANDQEQGVASYGMVVDLMLGWWDSEAGIH